MNFENVQVFRSDPRTNVGGLSVIEFGKQHVSGLITERRLPDYAAVFVEKGRGTLTTEQGGTQEVVGPALFWLFPNCLHSYGPDKSTTWLERWVLFRGSMVDEFRQKGLLNPAQPLVTPVNFSEVARRFSTLHSEMLKRDALGWASAAATIHRLVVQMASNSKHHNSISVEKQRLWFADIVEERAFENIDFKKLADELQVSPATLRRFSAWLPSIINFNCALIAQKNCWCRQANQLKKSRVQSATRTHSIFPDCSSSANIVRPPNSGSSVSGLMQVSDCAVLLYGCL